MEQHIEIIGQQESVYDRINVIIAGEELTARPIEFDLDASGMPIKAIRFETVDPTTGQLLQFNHNSSIVQPEVEQVKSGPRRIRNLSELCPFVDPLELGLMVI